jgi:hypothetical protein
MQPQSVQVSPICTESADPLQRVGFLFGPFGITITKSVTIRAIRGLFLQFGVDHLSYPKEGVTTNRGLKHPLTAETLSWQNRALKTLLSPRLCGEAL